RRDASRPGAGARLLREAEETLAGRGDAVRLAGEGEILPDLAHAVVHPPDVAEHPEHVAEVGLLHRRHGRGTRRSATQAPEVEEAAERIGRHLAEEVIEDRLRRAQRLVRDARRVPDEERLHAELRRGRVRDPIEQGVEEAEQVAEMEGALRVVRRPQVAATARWRTRRAGGTVRAAEDPLAGTGAGVEAVVADRAGELAAEEGAVAADLVALVVRIVGQEGTVVQRAQRRRDGAEGRRGPALSLHALLVASGEDAGERRKAPRCGVVRDGENGAV